LLSTNSNIYRDGPFGRRWLFRWLLAALAGLCLANSAHAIDPNRKLSQYIRDRWGSEKDFPGGFVYAIAQTSDGYLWVGTDKGLVRFDGLNFHLFQEAIPGSSPIGPVLGLTTDAEGNLWIRLQSTKVLCYRNGKFEPGHDKAAFSITAMYKASNGDFLVSSLALGALRYSQGGFLPLTAQADSSSSMPSTPQETRSNVATLSDWSTGVVTHRLAPPYSPVIALAETADGKVWMGTQDRGLFYVSGGQITSIANGLPDQKINCILPVSDHELWVGTDKGVVRWSGTDLTRFGVPRVLQHTQVLALIRDRDANIWAGTPAGILRFNAEGVSRDDSERGPRAPVTALLEDREGNIWTGSSLGIERLRDSAFVTYSAADGLPSDSNGPVYVDGQQRLWFAPLEGGLYWLKGGRVGSVSNAGLGHDVIYSITGDGLDLWVGRQQGGITYLRYGGGSVTAETYTEANGLAQNSVFAIEQSQDGSVWAGTLSGGVTKFTNGHFTNYTTASGMLSNTVTSIAETPDGTMWFATPNGLSALSNGQWHAFTVRDGLPSADVYCLLTGSEGKLWIGSAAGLAFVASDHVQALRHLPAPLNEQIFGIADDGNGWLWVATASHVLRVKRSALLAGQLSDADVREYLAEDGLHGLEGVKRQRSVFADSLGRIWFSMNRGLSVVDPTRVADRSAPARVHIEAISADESPIDMQGPVRISAARQRIEFSYAGLSLSNPERVRYRYRLDGFDKDWSEPVTERSAVYTNLSPGSYLFRVMASSSQGLWNGSEATFPFEVQPMWWQTWWFRLCAVLATGVAVLAVYRLRVRQLAAQMQNRLEERLEERERIARDLHDTLLQGFFSAAMQLDIANDRLPADSPAKPIVQRVIELMHQVGQQGRNAIRSLRSSARGSHDLEQALSQIREEFPAQEDVTFRVIAQGVPRPLNPAVWDEVYRLGREAVINAFRHSRAKKIEVEVEYGSRNLGILVRDDGCGIDAQVLQTGREGHWGLSGMRERAEQIGAKLEVLSRPGAGTEVELSIPGKVAFESVSSDRLPKWLTGLFQGKNGSKSSVE